MTSMPDPSPESEVLPRVPATPTAPLPDLTDPDVRRMAQRNHNPEERWSMAGQLLAVYCETCCQTWPCATIKALRSLP